MYGDDGGPIAKAESFEKSGQIIKRIYYPEFQNISRQYLTVNAKKTMSTMFRQNQIGD